MTREDDRNGFKIVGLLLMMVAGFATYAVKKGRGKELVLTTSALLLTWYLMSFIEGLNSAFYWIPFIHYAIVWIYLLGFCKKTHTYETCEHWGDKDWWWSLDGWEFEEEVAKVFEKNGYKAIVTKKTGDGGIDIILYKDKKKYIVQCKHYNFLLGPEPVRALWGVKEDFRADEVIMIASSGVTQASKDFTGNKPQFHLMDLEDVMELAAD